MLAVGGGCRQTITALTGGGRGPAGSSPTDFSVMSVANMRLLSISSPPVYPMNTVALAIFRFEDFLLVCFPFDPTSTYVPSSGSHFMLLPTRLLSREPFNIRSNGSSKKLKDCCASSVPALGSRVASWPRVSLPSCTVAEKSTPLPRSSPLLTVTSVGGLFPCFASTSNRSAWKLTVGPDGSLLAIADRLPTAGFIGAMVNREHAPSTKIALQDVAIVRGPITLRRVASSGHKPTSRLPK